MQKKNRIKDDVFYSQIFRLVLPIVIQNLLSAAVSSADVVMLNYVGQSSISAVSLASQYANVLFMVFYGLGGTALVCLLLPLYDRLYPKFPKKVRMVLCLILLAVFIADITYCAVRPNTGEGISWS